MFAFIYKISVFYPTHHEDLTLDSYYTCHSYLFMCKAFAGDFKPGNCFGYFVSTCSLAKSYEVTTAIVYMPLAL
jgi:hypothetical protein